MDQSTKRATNDSFKLGLQNYIFTAFRAMVQGIDYFHTSHIEAYMGETIH